MALFLAETSLTESERTGEAWRRKLDRLGSEASDSGGQLVEVQIAEDFARAFLIVEGADAEAVRSALGAAGIEPSLLKPVRLVGRELDEVKRDADGVNYLVEWNLPADLSMEQYLERKKRNSVHYAEVPEVVFSRTYVCEDMSKCLCFYQAPDEAAVVRAREAVKTPIDAITPLKERR